MSVRDDITLDICDSAPEQEGWISWPLEVLFGPHFYGFFDFWEGLNKPPGTTACVCHFLVTEFHNKKKGLIQPAESYKTHLPASETYAIYRYLFWLSLQLCEAHADVSPDFQSHMHCFL